MESLSVLLMFLAIHSAASYVDNQCDESMIATDLSADIVCYNSFNRVTTSALSNFTQLELDFGVVYLCDMHCGARFYNATEAACNGTQEAFRQLHCARNTLYDGEETIYCAYIELYGMLAGVELAQVQEDCQSITLGEGCSANCSTTIGKLLRTFGCCLTERFNSPIGVLRQEDYIFALLKNSTLYETCGYEVPDECVPTYVNGEAVFVDPIPTARTSTSGSLKLQVQIAVNYLFALIINRLAITILMIVF